jgi:hypothetical protein
MLSQPTLLANPVTDGMYHLAASNRRAVGQALAPPSES